MSMSLPRRWGARTLAVAAALALIPAFSPVTAVSAAVDGRTAVTGDGLAEMAVGESGNNVGAGAVHVFYGHKSGLVRDRRTLNADSAGCPGSRGTTTNSASV